MHRVNLKISIGLKMGYMKKVLMSLSSVQVDLMMNPQVSDTSSDIEDSDLN